MIRLRVLGESVIEVGEHSIGPDAATLFALTLYLAFERDAHVTRQSLIDLLWPESGGERGRHCLRQTLYKLRQLGAPLRASASHVELPGVAVAADFLELAAGAPLDAERLRRAGSGFVEFLPGYVADLSPRFTEWLEERRAHVQSVVRRALAGALLDLRARHRWVDVEAVARQYLRLDPLNEEATLALAEATALTGSKAQALSMLDRYLGELGPGASEIRLPATLLRRRIAERVPERRYSAVADACFEGREESMEVLAGLLREARSGRGQACLIWGEAGIGKTRLAAECTKAAVLQGAQVVRVGCEASDARRPLSLFVDAVPPLLNLRGALGCSPASMSYLRRLTEHDPTAHTPSDAALDADFLFARVRRSIFDLVDAVASEGTLVFVVEDVHWLDQTSWEVLRAMIDWASSRKLLFLFTSRTEHPTGVPQEAPSLRLVRHRLGAITEDAAGRLFDALCEGAERVLGAELRAWYVRVAEGNPLFLRELAREWVDRGRHDRLPASLATVLEDRVRKLSPTALRLLQISALLGKHATLARIEAIIEYRRHELIDCAVSLEQASLLSPEGGGLRPRHELIAATALNTLGEASRRVIHHAIALALSRELRTEPSPVMLWECIEHLQLAGETGEVVELVSRCSAHLIEIGLPKEAAEVFERASKLPLRLADTLAMLNGWSDALRLAGMWPQARDVLQQLRSLQLASGVHSSTHSKAEIELVEAQLHSEGSSAAMLCTVTSCVLDESADVLHRLSAAHLAMRLADHCGDRASATHIYETARRLGHGEPRGEQLALNCALVFHSSYGSLRKARSVAELLVHQARAQSSPLALCRALRESWIPMVRLGDYAAASEAASEAYSIAERYQFGGTALAAADDVAAALLESGDIGEAAKWSRVAFTWAEAIDSSYLKATQRFTHARVFIAESRHEDAKNVFPFTLSDIFRDTELRRQTASLALWLRLNPTKTPETERALSVLVDLHKTSRELGGQDYSTYCLAYVLHEHGNMQSAHSLVREYALRHRRETGPLPYYLSELISTPVAVASSSS